VNGSALQVAIALAQAVALLMSVAFISYALIIVIPYLRYRPSRAGDGAALDWHLFVPALNEERVIGGTIDYLRATFPRAHVWVIDDDSEDGTASIGSPGPALPAPGPDREGRRAQHRVPGPRRVAPGHGRRGQDDHRGDRRGRPAGRQLP
jgi:1,2-diacylglycerol 3-beta-glucosyltransferase